MGAILDSLAGKRIAVCVGAGGVGKTTLAAAIGLRRALDGGRVLVCTIDPARRLAAALGLESLGNFEARVPAHKFAAAGLAPRGQLHAMMLDVKRTWDDLIARHAPDRHRQERIYQNRIYQQLSSALAGLSARQSATANNIANINTPNYRAQTVSFESALAASVHTSS